MASHAGKDFAKQVNLFHGAFGGRAFSEIAGEVNANNCFCCSKPKNLSRGSCIFDFILNKAERGRIFRSLKNIATRISQEEFSKIPGSPVAYWVSDRVRGLFSSNQSIGQVAAPRKGNTTTDNTDFTVWPEVNVNRVIFDGSSAAPLFNGLKMGSIQ